MLKPKIIIAPISIHHNLIKQMLDTQQSLVGVSIITFNVFIQNLHQSLNNEYLTFAQSYHNIQKIKSQCTTIQHSLDYPMIVKDMITFTQSVLKLNIDLDKLPNANEKEKDIALCVHSIAPIYKDNPSLASIKDRIDDASHIEIYPFFMDYFQNEVVTYLISKGATYHSVDRKEPINKEVHYALNHAHEAEALAQYILNNQDSTTLIVSCDMQILPDLVMSAFNRHSIPFSCDIAKTQPIIVHQFISLYKLLVSPSIHHFIECVHNHVFNLFDPTSIFDYIQLLEIDFEDLFHPFMTIRNQSTWNTLDKRDINKLAKLEEKAEVQRLQIIPFFNTLTQNHINDTFNHFTTHFNDLDFDNKQALHQIKTIIEEVSTVELDAVSFDAIIEYLLSNIKVSSLSKINHVHLTSHKSITKLDYDKTIIIGANQSNFPGFIKQNGIIDENYLKQLPYPSLNDRLDLHAQQLDELIYLSPSLIVSYATSTFEGKSMAPAHDLIHKVNSSPSKWPMKTFGIPFERKYTLDHTLAKRIFFFENELFGSVSSFEVFFNCSYRYFLKTGLKLRDHKSELNLTALMGTIAHAIVEELIKIDAKTYAQQTIEGVYNLVQPYFDDLKIVMIKKTEVWDFISDLLANNLWLALQRLDEMEQDTEFAFYEAELKFNHEFQLNNDILLKLQGFIDRIDQNSNFFRILDYKSSDKNLSLPKVKAGLQLQLLTYLVVADSLFETKPSGAFYFSFLNQTLDIAQQRIFKNEIINHSEDDFYESFIKKHKLSGWFVNEDASMYRSGRYVKHISKSFKVTKQGLFDFEILTNFLVHLYTYLSEELKQGKIERNPVQGACDYCEFKHICIFKGSYKKLQDFGEQFDKLKGV